MDCSFSGAKRRSAPGFRVLARGCGSCGRLRQARQTDRHSQVLNNQHNSRSSYLPPVVALFRELSITPYPTYLLGGPDVAY